MVHKLDTDRLFSSAESQLLSSKILSASLDIASTSDLTDTTHTASRSSAEASGSTPVSEMTEEEALSIREKISNDLKSWQEKFAKAADKGTEDLEERVKEITNHRIRTQVHGVGEALLIQLEESSSSQLAKSRNNINNVVKSLPEDPTAEDLDRASEEVAKIIRAAGLNVKNAAQALRSWRQAYDSETQSLVTAASDSTLEVIDNIRDLGLQEVGMRWAWMEGVTYKDWSRYHALKKTFEEWRVEVAAIAKDHGGLKKAEAAGEKLESQGMTVAEDTAKELARLKEVGLWKVQAGDSSDDFSTKIVPPKAAVAGSFLKNRVSSMGEKVAGTSQGGLGGLASQASQQATDVLSTASSGMLGSEPGIAEKATRKVSEAINGTPKLLYESAASAVSMRVESISKKASGAIADSSIPIAESLGSFDSSHLSQTTSAVIGTLTPAHESLSSDVSKKIKSATESASSLSSQVSKKVFGGAMAQHVEERIPIFDNLINEDDDASYSEKLESILSRAGDKFADVTRAVGDAMEVPTSTQGSVESITSVANDKYLSALDAASSALYGTKQGTGESIASLASDKYTDAVAA